MEKVIFLIELDSEDDVFAFFPEIKETHDGWLCYAHIGQHSTCGYLYADACKRAKPEQYNDLKTELESIGYNLEIIK